MDTTFDEARRCPRCEELGSDIGGRSGPHGSTIHTIKCVNDRCQWFATTYIVQVMSDGSVAKPTLDRDKSFPKIPDRTEAVQAQLERLYQQSLSGGETSG